MALAERKIEYYFSFLSLWSYVGSLAFRDLVDRTDARVLYKPVDLFAVFAAGGGKPVKERPLQRQAYRLVEMQRWRQIRGIPLVLHPKYYPADPSLAHRVLLAALDQGSDVAAYVHAGLKAVWADERDVGDPDTVRRLAEENGLDGGRLLHRVEEEDLREREAGLTREAIGRQVFGAPFYFYRDEPFWGQDRLDLLEAAINGSAAPITLPDLSAPA
ncbi:2-hydroxychromene-2-carboxylate isomerase [Methylobacterium sp. J-030]|uniref:2-hydroxychromene-2-carboxylate isomerase n=1 Tax=Methylobacterium sp. J-030 TaxID=2836627 RepID=UPI001FB9BA5E|nr:2-hydroxychromene-2-carboxylate isomerase [Methylobacterium sp. J-030]MCJ2068911.1 2-hydroxychromene-2-carboxylate isomerase [Methylobacterium sp. J-030]